MFTRTVIVGSTNSVSAVSPQLKGGKTYRFVSWSDGGAQTHTITAPTTARTYTARFKEVGVSGEWPQRQIRHHPVRPPLAFVW